MKRNLTILLLSVVLSTVASVMVLKHTQASSGGFFYESDSGRPQVKNVVLDQQNFPDFTYAAETAVDAVVYVRVTSTQTMQQAPNSIFDFFFGLPQQGAPQQRERTGSGSGVIIREDG